MKSAAALASILVLGACNALSLKTPSKDCARSPERAARVEELLVVGHRGAAKHAVENTVPSMVRALADGANAVEIDLSLTKDGVVVLWHDWDPNDAVARARQEGQEPDQLARPRVPADGDSMRRPVHELTLDELRRHYGYVVDGRPAEAEIPTLEQFLDWAVAEPDLAYVLFDLKIPAALADRADIVVPHVRDAVTSRGARFRYVFLTPHVPVYDRASALVPDDALSFDVDPGAVVASSVDCKEASSARAVRRGRGYASTVAPVGVEAEAWHTLQELLVCDLTARDRTEPTSKPTKVFAATINDPDELGCLVDVGVDGIVTDDPSVLRRIQILRKPAPGPQ